MNSEETGELQNTVNAVLQHHIYLCIIHSLITRTRNTTDAKYETEHVVKEKYVFI
jgi:hypothetical protein